MPLVMSKNHCAEPTIIMKYGHIFLKVYQKSAKLWRAIIHGVGWVVRDDTRLPFS
jgi:hypothetical protein